MTANLLLCLLTNTACQNYKNNMPDKMMTNLVLVRVFLLSVLTLSGCASSGPTIIGSKTASQTEAFNNGNIRLDCRLSCASKAGNNFKDMEWFHHAGYWNDLAKMVMDIGYGNDLTYFYLGRAAEGLNQLEAAKTYYQLSFLMPTKCDTISSAFCFGHVLPNEVNERIASIDSESKSEKSPVIQTKAPAILTKPLSLDRSNIPVTPLKDADNNTLESNLPVKLDKYNEVKITKSGGVYLIPVSINDVLQIKFILDSGASDVAISPDVFLTLFKTETIEKGDWLPGKQYQIADGSIVQSNRFKIRTLKIGNQILKNVACSISSSIDAPMLLGQAALEQLGNFNFDYDAGIVRFQNKSETILGCSTDSDCQNYQHCRSRKNGGTECR